MSRTLIKDGCVLTLGARTPNYEQADVLIEDEVISEIGVGIRTRGAEVVDASGAIVMPGFVDGHRHVARSFLSNLTSSPLSDIEDSRVAPDDLYAATLVGLLAAAEAGITTVVDWTIEFVELAQREAALQAHADSGLRTVLISSAPHSVADAGSRASVALSADSPDIGGTVAAVAKARDLGLRSHVHAGVDHSTSGLVGSLGKGGLLDPNLTLVHCTNLADEDFDLISASGAAVVLTPVAEMTRGLGVPPMQELLDRRVKPGLGVDYEVDSPGDLFAQLRAVNSVQHAALFDRKLAGKGGIPNLLSTRDVIKYGTIDGARAIGLASQTGSLEPGKQADVVVLRVDTPNLYPVNDPIGAVVWGMDTSNVDTVFVAGEAVVRAGDVIRASSAMKLAAEVRERLSEQPGDLTIAGRESSR